MVGDEYRFAAPVAKTKEFRTVGTRTMMATVSQNHVPAKTHRGVQLQTRDSS